MINSPENFDDLRDRFKIVTHPGGNRPPMCDQLETIFRETRADGELIDVPDAEVLALLLDGQIVRTRASLKMTQRIQRNGLIHEKGHPFRGFWAHSVGEDRFLLGRPNGNSRAGVVHTYFPMSSFHADSHQWRPFYDAAMARTLPDSFLDLSL